MGQYTYYGCFFIFRSVHEGKALEIMRWLYYYKFVPRQAFYRVDTGKIPDCTYILRQNGNSE